MRESAAAGLVAAKHQLAILLVKNPDLAASSQEVPTLLKEAAEAGEWRSSVALGLLSRDGLGVPVDSKTAYYHYRVAALQGGDEARRVVANDLDAISARLGPEQAAAIDSEAESFAANHHVALQFVNKDGARWKDYPTYAVVNPEGGAYAGRVIPTQSSDYVKSSPNGELSNH
jgi:TPR repeat protein